MDESRIRAEQLLTLSSAARRVSDLVAAAGAPVRYEVLRHLLRTSEEDMIDALNETIAVELVRRGDDPFMYVPFDEATGAAIRESMGEERAARLRAQLAGAAARVGE